MSARLKEPHVFIVTSETLPRSCCILPDLTDLVKAIQCSTGRFFGGRHFAQEKPATVHGFYQKLLCMQKLATRTDAETHKQNLSRPLLKGWAA